METSSGASTIKPSRFDDVCPVILAAGKGKRMGGGDMPKVICKLHNKSLIEHLLDHVGQSRLSMKPVAVVGHGAEFVKKQLGDRVNYVEQKEQLGTGHAVKAARELLENNCGHVLVLYGDHPYVPAYVIDELVSVHKGRGATVTITTSVVPDFEAWRAALYDYGRVIRDKNGDIQKIVELKDATEEQKKIREVNVGYCCYDASWLWENLEQISNNNSQGEYYLTDLVQRAIEQHKKVSFFTIDPIVSIGVNTEAQLQQVHKLLFGKDSNEH
jgi:bifunctional UDP-N-acetylglucosamine pyrophosphorylase/glucosamine-1-phosphate N-acetyltransferase